MRTGPGGEECGTGGDVDRGWSAPCAAGVHQGERRIDRDGLGPHAHGVGDGIGGELGGERDETGEVFFGAESADEGDDVFDAVAGDLAFSDEGEESADGLRAIGGFEGEGDVSDVAAEGDFAFLEGGEPCVGELAASEPEGEVDVFVHGEVEGAAGGFDGGWGAGHAEGVDGFEADAR